MKIHFNTDTIAPMLSWLSERRKNGFGNEVRLREILSMPDYQVEFSRYGMEGLPVCGISLEEAVDFFMNFDSKDFENKRLALKKPGFMKFYNDLESQSSRFESFLSFSEADYSVMETLLGNALPESELSGMPEMNIIFIVSIGNSMGWPYEHYIDYDIASLDMFGSKEDFLHVTAHEIHHQFMGGLLAPEGIAGSDFFLQNFAFEGLAVHYCNNLGTLMKRSKYNGPVRCMCTEDMAFYEEHFDEIFDMIRSDYEACKGLGLEDVARLVSKRYERFDFMGRSVQQYPTYYFGCYMWGLVDLKYGKEKLFEAISNPPMFVELYNQAALPQYRF